MLSQSGPCLSKLWFKNIVSDFTHKHKVVFQNLICTCACNSVVLVWQEWPLLGFSYSYSYSMLVFQHFNYYMYTYYIWANGTCTCSYYSGPTCII